MDVLPTLPARPTTPSAQGLPGSTAEVAKSLTGNGKRHLSAEKINAVAEEFESQFITQMLSSMFATQDVKEGLGGSDAEETYQSFLIDAYGKTIAHSGGIGVAAQVKEAMLKYQEV